MNWQIAQGLPCPLPKGSWDKLLAPYDPRKGSGDRWLKCLGRLSSISFVFILSWLALTKLFSQTGPHCSPEPGVIWSTPLIKGFINLSKWTWYHSHWGSSWQTCTLPLLWYRMKSKVGCIVTHCLFRAQCQLLEIPAPHVWTRGDQDPVTHVKVYFLLLFHFLAAPLTLCWGVHSSEMCVPAPNIIVLSSF